MAISTSILITIGSIIVVSYCVDSAFKGSGDTLTFIKAISLTGISVCIAGVIESKKDKPNIEAIALASILNVFGIGAGVYQLLIDKESPRWN